MGCTRWTTGAWLEGIDLKTRFHNKKQQSLLVQKEEATIANNVVVLDTDPGGGCSSKITFLTKREC